MGVAEPVFWPGCSMCDISHTTVVQFMAGTSIQIDSVAYTDVCSGCTGVFLKAVTWPGNADDHLPPSGVNNLWSYISTSPTPS